MPRNRSLGRQDLCGEEVELLEKKQVMKELLKERRKTAPMGELFLFEVGVLHEDTEEGQTFVW